MPETEGETADEEIKTPETSRRNGGIPDKKEKLPTRALHFRWYTGFLIFQLVSLLLVGCWIPVSSSQQPDRLQDEPNFRTLPASNPFSRRITEFLVLPANERPSSEGTESLGIPGLRSILCRAAGFPIVPAGRHDCARMVADS